MACGESVPSSMLSTPFPVHRRCSALVGRAGACRRARRPRQAPRPWCPTAEELGASSRALTAAARGRHGAHRGLVGWRGPGRARSPGTAVLDSPGAEKLGRGRPGGRQCAHLRHLRETFRPWTASPSARPSPRALGPSAPAVAVRGGWGSRAPPVRPGGEPPRRAGGRVVPVISLGGVRKCPGPSGGFPGPCGRGRGAGGPVAALRCRAPRAARALGDRGALRRRGRAAASPRRRVRPHCQLRGAFRADARPLAHPSASTLSRAHAQGTARAVPLGYRAVPLVPLPLVRAVLPSTGGPR